MTNKNTQHQEAEVVLVYRAYKAGQEPLAVGKGRARLTPTQIIVDPSKITVTCSEGNNIKYHSGKPLRYYRGTGQEVGHWQSRWTVKEFTPL